MTEPLYGHTEAELRYAADLLALLNKRVDGDDVGVTGELQLCWSDRIVGTLKPDDDDPDDFQTWLYFPAAKGEGDT